MIVHAGLIALYDRGGWRGALIRGPSGVGKSDLALRALAQGFDLVADDYTRLFISGGALFGRAPDSLSGLIEIRGLGVEHTSALRLAKVDLCVQCKTSAAAVERLPQRHTERILGLEVPAFAVWPLEFSAPAKIRRALEGLGGGRQRAYQ
jgi:serine kinase of HPr protein (carbohydrate metabolism regulator)